MSDLTPEIAADVIAACQAGAGEAAEAMSRALDAELTIEVGEAANFDPAALPDGFDGPGLAVLMTFGDVGAVATLPASTELLPDWVKEPDATGESKLSTLAQELSMLLVPETLMAEDFQAAWVESLSTAIERAGVAEGAGLAPLTLTAGEKSGQLSMLWPASAPAELFDKPAEAPDSEEPSTAETAAEQPAPPEVAPVVPPRQVITDMSQLPNYSRSLLKVEVPVIVRLASKKQTVNEIVELGPGSIITFDKSCDEPVHLTVGDEPIAQGEVVKVGEKFGIRIDEMVMPDEAFKSVRRSAS